VIELETDGVAMRVGRGADARRTPAVARDHNAGRLRK
jgi:hypothetical protein